MQTSQNSQNSSQELANQNHQIISQSNHSNLLNATQQAFLDIVRRSLISVSSHFEDQHRLQIKKKGLREKYRKMIPNLRMISSHQTCTICLEPFVRNEIIKKMPCGHIFHRMCGKQWLKQKDTCPICRLNLSEYFRNQEEDEKRQRNRSSYQNIANENRVK